jgi:hypothetical protein
LHSCFYREWSFTRSESNATRIKSAS